MDQQIHQIAVSGLLFRCQVCKTFCFFVGFPAYKLVADPDSLSRTVEHMFHLSFLVQRGKAKMEYDEKQGAVVRAAQV